MRRVQAYITKLEKALTDTHSIRGALFCLLEFLKPYGAEHLTYVLMLHPSAYKRGDLMASSTFPMEMWDYYWQSGAMLTDALIEVAPFMAGPTSINLEMVSEQYSKGSAPHKYFSALVAEGWPLVMGYPVLMGDGTYGLSGLGVVCSHHSIKKLREPEFYLEVAKTLQRGMRLNGHFRRYFALTDKEIDTLERMAKGSSAAEAAEILGLKQRSIEMRLQSARKKLRALTTAEAIFKATAYSILFTQ